MRIVPPMQYSLNVFFVLLHDRHAVFKIHMGYPFLGWVLIRLELGKDGLRYSDLCIYFGVFWVC